jgi:hypothetical protein
VAGEARRRPAAPPGRRRHRARARPLRRPQPRGLVPQPWPPPWFAGSGVEGGAEAAGPGEAPPQEGH